MIYNYPKFKIRLAPDSKQRQGLRAGDIVRRQYLDGNTSRYSLMAVLETGTEQVDGADGRQQLSPYFIGGLLEGDEPCNGELLDFVRITSLTDPARSGALYLTASDAEAPYLEVIDGMGSERSLCRPSGNQNICRDSEYLDCSYTPTDGPAARIYTLCRSAAPATENPYGLELPLPATLDHPQRIVISFRSKSSKPLEAIPLTVGYTDRTETDVLMTFDAGIQWNYHLFAVTIDYPPSGERTLSLDLTNHLTAAGDTLCIADMNVVRLGDLSDYPSGSKARVGKITGIADPLFGVLEGYGAYFQNLYATKNVNVAGTLTAGDAQGFASTFYVGRIHKNCMLNSLEGDFRTAITPLPEESPPTGIGAVSLLHEPSTELECQSETWTQAHKGQRYCFSFWAMSDTADAELQLAYNDTALGVFPLGKEWRRYHASFDVAHLAGKCLCMTFGGGNAKVASYQLESGEHPSLYQPTDNVLDETEGYGAWFNRGGIGGTIQNPLLKLEPNGSIRSANGSFVINADGTGYFAGGKFRWDNEQIELTGITLDWAEIAQHVPQLDWVEQWNGGKTHIGAELVVTPKIFAGVKHDDGLLTGVALGRFPVAMYNDGQTEVVTGEVEGIAGFDHGRKVFSIESSGDVSLGYGAQNIRYNAATGKIEFGSGVSAQWAGATYIDASGIFTGTLSAQTVNAIGLNASQITTGTLSGDRIAAGSIAAEKLDAASIRAGIIDTNYINSLSCTFIQGKIGGWTIERDSITAGVFAMMGQTPIQIRSSSSGSGYWFGGEYRPLGLSMAWYQVSNAGHFVFGEVASSGNTTKTGYIGLQMMSWDGLEYFCLSSNYLRSGSKEVYNRIAGWAFDNARIWKNSVSLGADGSIQNGAKWQLNNDGSGQIAAGNICWDAGGGVTFSPSVRLSWQNDIQTAKTENYGFAYGQNIVIYGDENLYYPVVLKGGEQTIKREILVRRDYSEQAPASWNPEIPTHHGGLILSIKANFGGWGGVGYSWDIYELSESYSRMFAGAVICGNYCMFAIFLRGGGTGGALYHLHSDQALVSSDYSPSPIPPAPQVCYGGDLIFQSGISQGYAPPPRTLNAAVEQEIRQRHFIVLAQGTDYMLSQHPLTYIGATGIYTGTLTALQVNAVEIDAGSVRTGTLSADRIAAGSIRAEKLDAQSIRAGIIDTDYINSLSCTFIRGKIGGWTIEGDSITADIPGWPGRAPIQLRPVSSGSGYWYTGDYRPMGLTISWHESANAGHIVMGQVAASGNAPRAGFIGLQMMAWDNSEYFCLSANYTRVGSKEVYNRIAGWAFDNASIWKNSVSLGADGSIQNGAKWQLNNDGSGRVASGNIAWDAVGNVSFGPSVTMQWNNAARRGQIYAVGTGLNNSAYNIVRVNGETVLVSGSRGLTLTVLDRSTLNMVSNTQYDVYAGEAICNNLAAALDSLGADKIVILTSFDAIGINLTLSTAIQRCGGMNWVGSGRYPYAFIGIPGIGANNGLTVISEMDGSAPYAELTTSVLDGMPIGFNMKGKRMTYIDGNGIYTGTISAGQISVDSTLVVGGSSYDGSISVRDAANNVKVLLNRSGITAVGGTIGGWSLNATQIYSGSVALSNDGTISNAQRWKLSADGSGYLAGNNFAWDVEGNINAKGCLFEDVTIMGSLRNAFVAYTPSIWINSSGGSSGAAKNMDTYDNVVVADNVSWQDVVLPWTNDQSGRRICLTHYQWHGLVGDSGRNMNAPAGQYFYEDGILKSQLTIFQEIIELMGYGDDQKFYGWIVTNRLPVGRSNKYGEVQRVLAQGVVTCTSSTKATVSCKSFDGQAVKVAKLPMSNYMIQLPWALEADQYMVMLTGISTTVNSVPIYASLRGKSNSYFTVSTQNGPSPAEGSFCFQVISTSDFVEQKS